MSKLIGYAKVSTQDQEVQLQIDVLTKAGCAKNFLFVDKISGAKTQRPFLEKCLSVLQEGNTLVVWRLDRLGRSMSHLVKLIEELGGRDIKFKSICDGAIYTTTALGELIFNIFSSLAQFERKLIQEHTRVGLESARVRGKYGGCKKIQSTDPEILMAKNMHKDDLLLAVERHTTSKLDESSIMEHINKVNLDMKACGKHE